MSYLDREYYRDEDSSGWFGGYQAPLCRTLILTNVAVFVVTLVFQQALPWLAMISPKVWQEGQIWRLLTYAFCHDVGQVAHIFFNMLALWFLGSELENTYGRKDFLWFYLTAAVFAGLCQLALTPFSRSPVVGASGAVAAVLMLFALPNPRREILFFFLPVQIRWVVLIYVIFDLHPLLYTLGSRDSSFQDNVAHAAHLGGMLWGVLFYRFDLRLSNWWSSGLSWRRVKRAVRSSVRAEPSLRLFTPAEESKPSPHDDFDRQVDDILGKISAHGEASLTDEERAFLKRASERYKHR